MVHAQNKGKAGEREVANLLRHEIYLLMHKHQYDDATLAALNNVVQRNQNQSAEGGGDITLFGLALEVKRCETLEVEKWWRQAVTSANRNGDVPVLIYRQNRKPWRVVMTGEIGLDDVSQYRCRVTIDLEDFQKWFSAWAERKIRAGDIDRI